MRTKLGRTEIKAQEVRIPRAGPEREALREKGQFWTPEWVAKAMVAWATRKSKHVFDPAVGAGAFFSAAKHLKGKNLQLLGGELYAENLKGAREHGLTDHDLRNVKLGDYLKNFSGQTFDTIVANPPYIRHHRLGADYKAFLQSLAVQHVGQNLDARAGIHVFFLIKALTQLSKGGRLAFIVPADTCEGKFAEPLWKWIGTQFRICGAVTFEHRASPFPGVDTNPIVLFIENSDPKPHFPWARVSKESSDFLDWCSDDLGDYRGRKLKVIRRETKEALATGLTRIPINPHLISNSVALGSFAKVIRGIATGDNDYFFMTSQRIRELGLPQSKFIRAVGRTRDVTADTLTEDHLDKLDREGRATFLLNLGKEPTEHMSVALRKYIERGVEMGLPERALIKQRNPWYTTEKREPPIWLFAYLGRRNCRFILNQAKVVPLTGFLGVYAKPGMHLNVKAYTRALNDPRTIENLVFVAKSYGGGALKVEPRNLERLLVPIDVLKDYGIVTEDLFLKYA